MTRRIDKTGFGDIKIIQDDDLFCYGMDAVILADFAARCLKVKRKNNPQICDFCTGNGIVPLILSHKLREAEFVGVEVQERPSKLAMESVALNELEKRINIVNKNIKELCKPNFAGSNLMPEAFDAITMNPPYTKQGCGIECDNEYKNIARHELLADLDDFIKGSRILLKEKGDLFIIHRPQRLVDVILSAERQSLALKELQLISGRKGQKPNLAVFHFVKNSSPELKILPQIFLRESDGKFSKEALKLYE